MAALRSAQSLFCLNSSFSSPPHSPYVPAALSWSLLHFSWKSRCCFHEQMVLNFGIKLCYMLTHLDSYPVLTYSVCELNRQTWPPRLLPLTVFFDFCLPLAFPFSLARSLELTLERVISGRFVKLIPLIQ
jgi:hypothetical protein